MTDVLLADDTCLLIPLTHSRLLDESTPVPRPNTIPSLDFGRFGIDSDARSDV